jgi:hypothetical protein
MECIMMKKWSAGLLIYSIVAGSIALGYNIALRENQIIHIVCDAGSLADAVGYAKVKDDYLKQYSSECYINDFSGKQVDVLFVD